MNKTNDGKKSKSKNIRTALSYVIGIASALGSSALMASNGMLDAFEKLATSGNGLGGIVTVLGISAFVGLATGTITSGVTKLVQDKIKNNKNKERAIEREDRTQNRTIEKNTIQQELGNNVKNPYDIDIKNNILEQKRIREAERNEWDLLVKKAEQDLKGEKVAGDDVR